MAITFYTNPMSRGRIARWMLEEVGEPYETVVVEWDAKPQALLDANPMGKLPTIVHDGAVVTEAAAICAYLADAFPAAGLAPPPGDRADYYRWLFFAAAPMEQMSTLKALKVEVPREQERMVGFGNEALVVDALEAAVSRRDYIAGNAFSAADVYVGSQIGWQMDMLKALPERPAFRAYLDRLQKRDAYARANEKDDALIRG